MIRVSGRSLLLRYVASFLGVVGLASAAYSAFNVWFAFAEHRAAIAEIQANRAVAAALEISRFVGEIERQLRWGTHLPWADDTLDSHRLDAARLLRQASAVTEIALLDSTGRERLFVSRLKMTRVEARLDRSAEPAFVEATSKGVHYGPVRFRQETEPCLTLAVAGSRAGTGVVMAEVDLKHVWDVVARIRVGRAGIAYVVDRDGRLIAHPDIGLVLRKSDASEALRAATADGPAASRGTGLLGRPALMASVVAAPLDWHVVVELPLAEADAPLDRAVRRSLWITFGSLLLALLFAVALSWRMLRPLRALTAGAALIGSGRLDHRISIRSGDEIEALGRQFNVMAGELEESRAGLERKVEARTQELAAANRAKASFLAAASHDLRQPLHALNLLVAQLCLEDEPDRRGRLTRKVESAVGSINELFDGLLDISRLEAGAVTAEPCAFPVQQLLDRIESTFAEQANAKGLRFRVVPCRSWVDSDPRLLERVVANLVANAVRYTSHGGIVVGCRRRGGDMALEVIDTGIGIAADQHRAIFGEFYQVRASDTRRGDGLGLGLAIVARLCELLRHPVSVDSTIGGGSRFVVRAPIVAARDAAAPADDSPAESLDPIVGKRVLVVDDDERVLESTAGLLSAWGCVVVVAASLEQALAMLGDAPPQLVVADHDLGAAPDGIATILALRDRFRVVMPGLLVTGEVAPEIGGRALAQGLHVLHKPVAPMRLRAAATQLLRPA